jgi:hypothetical protein
MSDEEIESNNKLIVEFLNWKVIPTHSKELRYENLEGNHYYLHKLKFHNSYDWLMLVVEKINKELYLIDILYTLNNTKVLIKLNSNNEIIAESYTENFNSLNAIFNAVIEFIKWYNKMEDERNRI